MAQAEVGRLRGSSRREQSRSVDAFARAVVEERAVKARESGPVDSRTEGCGGPNLEGGVYSVGALSLVVKEAAEEDVFVVLTGEGALGCWSNC
jgi:hypothetical protein